MVGASGGALECDLGEIPESPSPRNAKEHETRHESCATTKQ